MLEINTTDLKVRIKKVEKQQLKNGTWVLKASGTINEPNYLSQDSTRPIAFRNYCNKIVLYGDEDYLDAVCDRLWNNNEKEYIDLVCDELYVETPYLATLKRVYITYHVLQSDFATKKFYKNRKRKENQISNYNHFPKRYKI